MDLGIIYHIEEPRQFWAELEDILHISSSSSLSLLDAALRQFISICATYHQQYLQTPVQLEHACSLLLNSELFNSHSERLSSLVVSDSLTNTDPHTQLILQHVLLFYGRNHPSFFRSSKKWKNLIPVLMDTITLIDIDFALWVSGSGSAHQWRSGISVPIELRLSQLSVQILYEVCRIQILDLSIFTDAFIDHLFDLVEMTRDLPEETFNYGLIKLIIALNERFMVAILPANKVDTKDKEDEEPNMGNRVIEVLVRRLGSSKTFGENIIFILNRAGSSSEDRCTQLLILKILFILFTTPSTQEYFYTNDLRVLVDVFIRELGDLSTDDDSLQHTYLRVLHPLLTNTQLRDVPYKRLNILRVLESLISQADIRNVSATTKRLVERCLSATWAVEARKERDTAMSSAVLRTRKSQENRHSAASLSSDPDTRSGNTKGNLLGASKPHPLRDLKFSKSVDVLTLNAKSEDHRREQSGHGSGLSNGDREVSKPETVKKTKSKPRAGFVHDVVRKGSNDSAFSIAVVANTGAPAVANSKGQVKHYRPAPLPPSSPLSASSPPSPPHSHSSTSSSVSITTISRKIPPAIPSRSGKSVFRKKNNLTSYAPSTASPVQLELG